MPIWISLSTFKDLYSKETDLLSGEALAIFLKRLQSPEGEAIRAVSQIQMNDFLAFIESLKSPENIVFHGWVSQTTELENTLQKGEVSGKFIDAKGNLNHTLARRFQQFVTPYLVPILLRSIPADMAVLSNYFSFVQLLDEDTRTTVERQLFQPVYTHLEALKTAQNLEQEQALIELVQPLCSDTFIDSMNHLSKGSYALKMDYVDRVLAAIRTPACTVRFANWILKQMERLQLNNEHQIKLNNLRKELAAGKLRVKKLDREKSSFRLRPLLIGVFIVALLGAGVYLMIFKPFSDTKVHHAYDSANADFTEEELEKIDSLALEIDQESFLEGRQVDPNIIIQSGTAISLRKPFKTALMEQIYIDVNKDVTLKENYYKDSCGKLTRFKRYPGVENLELRTAKKTVQFRNDSDYDLVVYVTDNKTGGTVYSLLVKSSEMKEFQMNTNDVLTTVAGNDWISFIPPLGSFQEEKPSQDFRYHFCTTDHNYFESINTSLQLKTTSRDLVKFMVTGSRGSDYKLVDIYNVAAAY